MPFDCTKLSTAGYFDSWEAETRSSVSTLQGGSTQPGGVQADFLAVQNDIQAATVCILNEINRLGTSSTDISMLHQKILEKTMALSNGERDISLAKDRVAYIRHPEQNTSNYESWFPIDRPIHSLSLIVLIAITIFLGVFYIFVLMSLFNFNLVFYSAQNSATNPWFAWISQQLTLSFWITLIILIAVVIYFVKRN
jgi:ABC-type multidrug transport system permease subunit